MSTNFVCRAVEFVGDRFAVSAYPVGDSRRFFEYDRGIRTLAHSENGNGWVSGILSYRGVRYYAYTIDGSVFVEVSR